MPQFSDRRSIAAGAVVENILTGSQWEFLPYDAKLDFAVVGDANSHEVLMDVYSGLDVLAEANPISSAARFPTADDYTLHDVAPVMSRIKVRLRNTGAGAHVVQTVIQITEVG